MKLLIDIPEHIYEHAKETSEDSRDEFDAMRAIANGTPARCMDEAEKERLIKKNMLSIENRVRNVFNQGYEMGLKESKSENPNTCGDAISRQAVLDAFWKLNVELSPTAIWTIQNMVKDVPPVTPQQRTGRWIKTRLDDKPDKICDDCGTYCWKCSICGNDASGWGNFKYCPNCGVGMEVEE